VITSLIEQHDTVGAIHGADPFAPPDATPRSPAVWWCRPADDAIVLGSRQGPELLDADACRDAGLTVVRRRSGGGLVVIRRSAVVWLDLVLPHGIAPDDVRGAMAWAGERWRSALVDVARFAPADLVVHRGGMETSAWSDLVCFAGLGPGEVLLDGRKLVGLSQRRTRGGVRIQGLVHTASTTADLLGVMVGDRPTGTPTEPATVDVDPGALAAALTHRITPT
jgi:lipoate-protein ligase A